MFELSNLLRQRLGAQNRAENGAGVHPDADTLTAYSEQLLPMPERQRVLKHLAACADCRDVVALSQTDIPAAELQPVLKPAPVPLWRKLLAPALGVGGVIAATALIAILITQNPNKPNQLGEFKAAAPSTPQPAIQPSTSPAPEDRAAVNNEANAATREKDRNTRANSAPVAGVAALTPASQPPNRILAATKTAPAPAPPVLTAGLRKQDFVNSAFFETSNADVLVDGQNNNDLSSAPQPKGYTYDKRLTANAPRQFSDIQQEPGNNKSTVAILTPPPPPEHFGTRWEKTVIKGARTLIRSPFSAPAISSNSLTGRAMLTSPKFDPQKAEQGVAAAAPAARADSDSFASSGALSYATRGRAMSSAETTAATWKVENGKLLKAFGQSPWEDAHTPAAFEFTVVNSHGGEVWAGGTNAGLIHSYDGGNTWSLVRLGDGASGRIVSILFAGNHVQVTTSDDQSWSSADGGKSWTKN